MCARYTLTRAEKELAKMYNVQISGPFQPNYNLAPTQEGLVITADEPRIAQKMHFGLIPYRAESTKLNINTLNARSEEVMEKKTFAPLIKNHKTCLVLADSFYEWDCSFTIMTTQANKTVGKVHDPKFRMPVILDKFTEQFWLAKEIAPSDLLGLCKPYPDEKMIAYPVSTAVNSAVIKGAINNSSDLILPMNSQ